MVLDLDDILVKGFIACDVCHPFKLNSPFPAVQMHPQNKRYSIILHCIKKPPCCPTKYLQGLALVGPTLHLWYGSLGRLIPAPTTAGALARLALDQLAFAPVFIATIVTSLMALEGAAAEAPAKSKPDNPAETTTARS